MNIYDFKVHNAKGVEVPMRDYQGIPIYLSKVR